MSKNLLQITVTSEGTSGRVDIIGSIAEWNQNNAIDFRARCQELKDGGVTDVLVYMMTVGGDCFQANEIVNILIEMFGSYRSEGGAIVASAGTYIAAKSTKFEIAKNGQFMIHKPMGGSYGNETEVENYLTLLKNMTTTYYEAYLEKLKKPEADFKAKWNGGDFWMTAQEAKDWGFADDVKAPAKIDKQTQALLQAVIGKPNINQNEKIEMELKVLAVSLGLPESATEEQVNALIAENKQKAEELAALKVQNEQKAKEEKAVNIKAVLDKAESDKRIKATARANWQAQLEKDFDGAKALIEGLEPVAKLSDEIVIPAADGTGSTYNGKTFEQLQDENPELLAKLQDEKPEAYDALFADWKKRNRIN